MSLPQLTGFTIGVTADRRADVQIELLHRRGAETIHAPMLRTNPLGSESEIVQATKRIIAEPPHVTLLSTGVGVRGWFETAESLDLSEALLDSLSKSTVLARGKKAHGAAVTEGLEVHWQTPIGTADEMVAELRSFDLSKARVAIQLDGADSPKLVADIAATGADVMAVPVYRWTLPTDRRAASRLIGAICDRRVDAVTFTSRPQIENLRELAYDEGCIDEVVEAFSADVLPVCVGSICADAAVASGFQEPLVPERFRLGTMVRTLAQHLGARRQVIQLGGCAVTMQGRVVGIDGDVVRLTEREAMILRALATDIGHVYSKQQLLKMVWEGTEGDEHVVEVSIGRLRRSLGVAGHGIQTVHRRGYRLSA